MRYIITPLILIFISLIAPETILAQEKASGASAQLVQTHMREGEDIRADVLTEYLKTHNSPLEQHAKAFIAEADKYNLDWKLLVSIAGVESTFAKQLPYESYNAWGWGIYGDKIYRFPSYEVAIETISKELRERYMDKWGAEDVYQIGSYYAADPNWAHKVVHFMNKIDTFEVEYLNSSLSISL